MRIAFVSPLPPLPTGIADYSAELVPLLATEHEIELFHAQQSVDLARLPPAVAVRPASELTRVHRQRPFDATVYQMGNGAAHTFLYDLLPRVPGLLVLHDLVLHHSRAAQFLDSEPMRRWRRNPASEAAREAARPMLAAWRSELDYSYPGRGQRLDAVVRGTIGWLLPYAYPLFRIPVEASRAVLVHSDFMRRAVREEVPGTEALVAPMPATRVPVDRRAVEDLRRRLGLRAPDVVVGVYGLLTPEKRIGTVARAFGLAAARDPRLRLLLAGPVPEGFPLEEILDRAGIRDRSVVTGRVPFAELPTHIEAADIVVHLRYPTARETSAALLRVLAQGRPAIVADLEQQEDLPEEAVVRVDLADEVDLTTHAITWLAGDPASRLRLGEAAAAHVQRRHSPARIREAWRHALERTRRSPRREARDWPSHWARPVG